MEVVPPKPKRPRYSEGRDALLDATVKVVAREGLRGLTYRAVGAESHTTHALVTYHFASREQLLLEAGERARATVAASTLPEPDGDGVAALARALPASASRHSDAHAFLLELALEARRNDELRPEVRARYAQWRALASRAVARLEVDDDREPLARLVLAAVDGLVLQQLIDGDEAATAAALAALLRLLGVAEEDTPPREAPDAQRRRDERAQGKEPPPREPPGEPPDVAPPEFRPGREALLDATAQVVAESGFDGLTYRAVAARAGTTHSLVSYHFGSRDALIHEAAIRASRRATESASLLPEGDSVEDYLRDIWRTAEEDMDTHLFQYEMALQARRRPDLEREISALYEEYFRITERQLEALGVEPLSPAFARFVFAAVDGIVLQQVVLRDPRRTEEAVAVLRDVLRRFGARDGGATGA